MAATESKKALTRYALEAALIVFSVLLALFLDQVIEERRENRTIDEIVGHVAGEMQNNLDIINEWLPYHQEVAAKLDRHLASDELMTALLADGGINYFDILPRGVIQDFYSESSWQLAQQSEMTARLDFEVTNAMSKAYHSQAMVSATLQRMSDFFFDRATMDPEQLEHSLTILRNLMRELAGQEAVLRQLYEDALEEIENR